MSEATLYEHEDGRYAVAPENESPAFTHGDPKWHRVGPVDVSALASRQEAPAAAGAAQAVAKLRDVLAFIATYTPDDHAQASVTNMLGYAENLRETARRALAATPAPEPVISAEDSLRTRLRWSQEKVEQLEEENRTLRGRLPGPNLDDLLKAAQPIEREDWK